MTSFVSDNPGDPESDAWDEFYEWIHDTCEGDPMKGYDPMTLEKACDIWLVGLHAYHDLGIRAVDGEFTKVGGGE